MRKAFVFKERQRYSIRKYSFGAASVLIGASLLLGGHALAQEQANNTDSITDYEVTVNNSEAPQIDKQLQKLLPMSSINQLQDLKRQDLILLAVKLLPLKLVV